MPKVGLVVDSTCDMSAEELASLGVELVSLKVSFGDETFLDAREITPSQFFERLATAPELPKTSQPSPQQFSEAFDRLIEQGCESIVSLSLSSAISGTYQTSVMVAREYDVPVYCIDTRNVTQGLALIVEAAVKLRDQGLNGEQLAQRITHIAKNTQLLFVIYSMDNLVKGGRAGRAAGLAASLLDIKPILTMDSEGVITPFKKCKGKKRAVIELAKYVAKTSQEKGPLNYAVIYTNDEEDVEVVRQALAHAGVEGTEVRTGSNGAVIGTYVPEACGIAFYPQECEL